MISANPTVKKSNKHCSSLFWLSLTPCCLDQIKIPLVLHIMSQLLNISKVLRHTTNIQKPYQNYLPPLNKCRMHTVRCPKLGSCCKVIHQACNTIDTVTHSQSLRSRGVIHRLTSKTVPSEPASHQKLDKTSEV